MIEPPLMFTVEPLLIPGGKYRAAVLSAYLVLNMLWNLLTTSAQDVCNDDYGGLYIDSM